MKQFNVETKNKVGALANICEGLSIVNIDALATGDGIVRVVTNDETSTRNILAQRRFPYTESDLLVMDVPNRPGELAKVTRKLANAGINVESFYLINHSKFAMTVDNLEEAKKLIRSAA